MFPDTYKFWSAALLIAATLTVVGCNGCNLFADEPPPWRFTGEQADYEVIFPSHWHSEPSGSINPEAELVASHEGRQFFMVIPQQMPSFPEPDVLQLQQAGLQTLDDSVDDLVIERQGPIEVDGVSGMSVFATATVSDQPISYITCYFIHDDIGYQIVGFGPEAEASELYDEIDTILARWTFDSGDELDEDAEYTLDDLPVVGPLEGAGDETAPIETDD